MAGDSQVRAKAIEGFVERLAHVRLDAGTPSFREMAKRSGAISHATLHDALQGARMPSWETTVEFAKACGVDPQELREDWERAAAIVHADCEGASAPADEVAPQDVTSEATLEPASTDAASPDVGSPQPARSRRPLLLIGGAAALAIAAVLAVIGLTNEPPPSTAATSSTGGEAAAAYSSAPNAPSTTTGPKGCPVNVRVSPGTKTLVPADGSEFVADVTIKDCTVQPRGQSVVKTWAFKNTGTVEWKGRFLHRINAHEGAPGCRAPERVAVPDTKPGQTVNVSVTIATPNEQATCFGRWMQTDSEGNFTFPEQRPYYYTFKVE